MITKQDRLELAKSLAEGVSRLLDADVVSVVNDTAASLILESIGKDIESLSHMDREEVSVGVDTSGPTAEEVTADAAEGHAATESHEELAAALRTGATIFKKLIEIFGTKIAAL